MRPVSLFFIATTYVLCSCGSQKSEWRNDFTKINQDSLYHNNYDGWELSTKEEYPKSVLYNIKKQDGDTLKRLSFFKDESGISVKEYFKTYTTQTGDTYCLEMDSSDTLYFYKQNGNVKDFIVGEYGYRYTSMLLDDFELDYYLRHEDSLRRVRGNNLPRLPKER